MSDQLLKYEEIKECGAGYRYDATLRGFPDHKMLLADGHFDFLI
jgi:hypothetical protein